MMNGKERKQEILAAAVTVAFHTGWMKMTRSNVAFQAGVAEGLVNRYFSTMTQLRRAVMRHAVQNDMVKIVAEGIALRDAAAMKASEELKHRCGKYLSETA